MKEIILDKRLSAIASYVKQGAIAADIGCDHGYLAAYLAQNGIAKHVYASDINSKPLAKARKLVDEHNLEKCVTTILSDGLDEIPHHIDTIIISGMGGELIADLLEKAKWAASPGREFILQPMTFAERLRIYLAERGFEIIAETPVEEEKRAYCVIHAHYTGNRTTLSEIESVIGKIDATSENGKTYVRRLHQKYLRILEGLRNSKEKKNIKKVEKLVNELEKRLGGE